MVAVGAFALRLILVAAAYFAGARLGYAFAIGGGAVTLWPPSGIMLAILLRSPLRSWPASLLGGLTGSLCSDLLSGYSLPLAMFASAANALEVAVAATVVRQWVGTPVRMASLGAASAIVVGGAILSNAVTAFGGALMLKIGFNMTFWYAWFVWWTGDGLGMVIFAPMLLAAADVLPLIREARGRRVAELAALAALLVAASLVAFGPVPTDRFQPGPVLVLPLLVWAALRFGAAGATIATLVVAGIAIWYAARGVGPFATHGLPDGTIPLRVYAFLAAAGISSLFTAAALEERRGAIAQLRQSEARHRAVLETAIDAIVLIDRAHRIQFANAATQSVFGYAPSELVGRTLQDLVPAPLRFALTETIARATSPASDQHPSQATALTGVRKNGEEVPIELSVGRNAGDGDGEGFTAIIRDITQKRAAESVLRQREGRSREQEKLEAIGRLAGGIAHDFNNMLTVIHGRSDLLAQDPQLGDTQRADVLEIAAASKRAAALTAQLLAFSRRQVMEPRVLRLQDALRALQPMLVRLIGEDITIVTPPSDASPVRADPSQVEQVLLNLALNARDAMPHGGTLRIEIDDVSVASDTGDAMAVAPGDYVRLTVTDTGLGMSAETMSHIFEPFFTTKPVGHGTGLGLATVHGIVEQNGGAIQVRSDVGRGTSFTILLPRGEEVPQVTTPGRRRAEPVGSGTVLVVEDEDRVRELLQRVLERAGYRVLVAGTPAAAREIAAHTTRIDTLLSDVVLPEMTGVVLAQHICEHHPHIRVLFMSGYTDDMTVRRGLQDGKMAMIRKPFTPEALLHRLEEINSAE